MDKGIRAARDLRAQRRINAAIAALAEKLGLEPITLPTDCDPALSALFQREAIADWLEMVTDKAVAPKRKRV